MDNRKMSFSFSSKPKGVQLYRHQIDCLNRFGDRRAFALFAEMGTGKTLVMIKDIEKLYADGEVDTVLVLAPNGVHSNWVNSEIPKFMNVSHAALCWRANSSKTYETEKKKFLAMKPGVCRILCMNHEAIVTAKGYDYAYKFLAASLHTMIVVDESDGFKNPTAIRTRKLMALAPLAKYRRIMTGTPVANAPIDLYAQMNFLDKDILGCSSYYAFKSEYCVLAPPSNPLVKKIMEKGCRGTPQIVLKKKGIPQYRNIDRLNKLIEPHSFFALKKDCLDLPEKIYKTAYYSLTKQQEDAYALAKNDLRVIAKDREVIPLTALTAITKMMQIESGSYMADGALVTLDCKTEKLTIAHSIVSRAIAEGSKVIVWCSYRFEVDQLMEELSEYRCVKYDGGCTQQERTDAINAMQNGDAQVFIGSIKAGGIGITLTAANVVLYYTNGFSLRDRLQSEDRAHRIGQRSNVVYYDLVAKGRMSEHVRRILAAKKVNSDKIMLQEVVRAALAED